MTKIVINCKHGGFSLSREAMDFIIKEKNIDPGKWNENFHYYENFDTFDLKRDDSTLIAAVEHLGSTANGRFAQLKIVEIPNDVKWQIEEYDGLEWIAEVHRTWS